MRSVTITESLPALPARALVGSSTKRPYGGTLRTANIYKLMEAVQGTNGVLAHFLGSRAPSSSRKTWQRQMVTTASDISTATASNYDYHHGCHCYYGNSTTTSTSTTTTSTTNPPVWSVLAQFPSEQTCLAHP